MVVYLGGRNRVEKGQPWNGLAISLVDFEMDDGSNYAFCNEQDGRALCTTNAAGIQHVTGRRDGWAMTKRMSQRQCNAGHNHPLADALWNADKVPGFSEWFIPSTGQWDLAMQGMNYGSLTYIAGENFNQTWKYTKAGKWLFEDADVNIPDFVEGDKYLTCTASNNFYIINYINQTSLNLYVYRYSDNYEKITYGTTVKNYLGSNTIAPDVKVRPFIAFEYGEGGSVDPEETWGPLQAPRLKSWVGDDGKFYKDVYDAYTNTGYTPVAYVAYYDQNASLDLYGKKYHGLAIGLLTQKYSKAVKWDCLADSLQKYSTRLSREVRQQNGFSEWFVPTKDVWKLVFEQGFNCPFGENDVAQVENHDAKVTELSTLFLPYNYFDSKLLWTGTEVDNNEAYYLDIRGLKYPIKFDKADKSTTELNGRTMDLCPMIAF